MKKNLSLLVLSLSLALGLTCALAADPVSAYEGENNQVIIYNIINNNNSQPAYGYNNVMCTERGGICTNGHYLMGTRKTIYSPSRSKLKSTRSQRLGLNI